MGDTEPGDVGGGGLDNLEDGDIFGEQQTPKLEISGGESSTEEPSIITLDPGSEPMSPDNEDGDEDDLFGASSSNSGNTPEKKAALPDDDVDIFGEKDEDVGNIFEEPNSTSKNVVPEKTVISEEAEEEAGGDKFDIDIKLSDPVKVGDGMSAYMAYSVTTQTSLNTFRRKEFSVKRRFSDFLGLHERLSEKHAGNVLF